MSEQIDDGEQDEPRRDSDTPAPGEAPVDDPSTGEDEPGEADERPDSERDASGHEAQRGRRRSQDCRCFRRGRSRLTGHRPLDR